MSDRRLPEDLNQWPEDPFALLGVNASADRREVRRAYAQLIRVYKPEHFPEQFRRIREAYELLEQRLSWMETNRAAAADASPAEAVSGAAAGDLLADGPAASVNEPSDPMMAGTPDRSDFWQQARCGGLREAYAEASRAAMEGRGDEGLFVRLFWMLRVAPEIDPARDARDWLIAGMKQCGLCGRLPELYRCELIEDPQEVLRPRCDETIRCSGNHGQLVEVVTARWKGAAKLDKWEVIGQDLESLRGRLQDESPAWGPLLLAAIDNLAWAKVDEARQTLAACRKEIEQVAEHWPPIAGAVDQRDVLLGLVRACEQLKVLTNLPAEWRKSLRALIRSSWNQPFEMFRRQLIDVLMPLVRNPLVGMEWLDRLDARCRPALQHFGALIMALAGQCGVGNEPPPNEVLQERLVETLLPLSKGTYPARWQRWMRVMETPDRSGRVELLVFCLQESVTVRRVMDMLVASGRQDLAPFLAPANNPSLHLMCLAYQAFWA